jgi:hypothetical protein
MLFVAQGAYRIQRPERVQSLISHAIVFSPVLCALKDASHSQSQFAPALFFGSQLLVSSRGVYCIRMPDGEKQVASVSSRVTHEEAVYNSGWFDSAH